MLGCRFLAQQEELGLQSDSIKWQQMGPAAAANVAADVAEMEFCLIERVSYQANSPELVRSHMTEKHFCHRVSHLGMSSVSHGV